MNVSACKDICTPDIYIFVISQVLLISPSTRQPLGEFRVRRLCLSDLLYKKNYELLTHLDTRLLSLRLFSS